MPSHESALPPRSTGDEPAAGLSADGAPGMARLPIVAIIAWNGAAMLAGQIAWIRLAAAQVGSTLSAVVVLLTAAMIGLSIGSRLVARRIERTAIGRRVIVQQLAAALVLLVSPLVINWVGNLAAAVAEQRGWHYHPAETLTLAAVAGAILLFNVPFGMLLPMAVEIDAKHRFGGLSRQVGLLGGVQLAGAAVGGVVLGLIVPMWIGFAGVLLLAGLVQLPLAIWTIIAIARRPGLLKRPAVPANGQFAPLSEPRTVRRLAGLLGLLSLAAMLVWLRTLSFYLGTSIYTFVLTAAMLVGGLAVGGWISASVAPRQRRPGQFLAAVLLVAAVLLALAGFWADMAPTVLPWVLPSALPSAMPSTHAASPFGEIIGRILVIFVMIGPPAVLIGSTLPLLLRLAAPAAPDGSVAGWPAGRAGRIVARVLASYTFGGALGAVIAFAGFLQMWDGRSALLAVAVGYSVAALWAEVLDPATGWHRSTARAARPDADADEPDAHTHRRRRRLHAATLKRIPWPNLALFFLFAAVCIWQAGQGSLFHKAYLPAESSVISEEDLPAAMLEGSDRPVAVGLAIDESRGGVVATRRNCATGRLELLVGLETIADDSPQSIYVQRTQGLLPLLLAPADHPRRALVVGLGSGASVAPLVQAGVERITVAEPYEAVTEFARRDFAQANDNLRDHLTVEFSPEAAPAGSAVPAAAPAAGSSAPISVTSRPTTGPAEAGPTTRPDAGVEVYVINRDGRSVLRFEPPGWQIILVNPTDPSAFGAGTLFSKEFYELASERLADDGIFVQWLPIWRMSRREVSTVARAFLEGFSRKNIRDGILANGFVLLDGVVDTTPSRPMLALVWNLPRESWASRITRLRPGLDRVTSRFRPSLGELGLGNGEEITSGLVDLSGLMNEGILPTDARPSTELNFGKGNGSKLFVFPEGPCPGEAIFLKPGQAVYYLHALQSSRQKLADAMRLVTEGDRGPSLRAGLAAATQADPENAFARLSLDRLDCQTELARVRAARREDKVSTSQAEGDLSAVAKKFPLDVTSLWMKFALQAGDKQRPDTKDAMITLEEILGRAENSSAAHYWKARLLSDQVADDLKAGRIADAARRVKLANAEKNIARALRNGETPADRALSDTIRAQLAAAKGLAASQPAK